MSVLDVVAGELHDDCRRCSVAVVLIAVDGQVELVEAHELRPTRKGRKLGDLGVVFVERRAGEIQSEREAHRVGDGGHDVVIDDALQHQDVSRRALDGLANDGLGVDEGVGGLPGPLGERERGIVSMQ